VELIDRRAANRPRRGEDLLSNEVRTALESNLAAERQTLVFLNRRGLPPPLPCPPRGPPARRPPRRRAPPPQPRAAAPHPPPPPPPPPWRVGGRGGPAAPGVRRRDRADRGDAADLLPGRGRRSDGPGRRAASRCATAHPARLARGRHRHPGRHPD